MWPNLLEIGWFKLSWFWIYLPAAVVWASFWLWRRLREESKDKEIFELTKNLLFGIVTGTMAGGLIETGRWLSVSGWGMAIGGGWMLWRWCQSTKIDFWETLDWFSVGAVWFWGLGALAFGPGAMYAAIAAAIILVLAKLVAANYRKIGWNKSGRVGISGLTVLVLYAIFEVVSGFFWPGTVYWWGMTLGQTIAGWVIAICLVTVYLRSGHKFKL